MSTWRKAMLLIALASGQLLLVERSGRHSIHADHADCQQASGAWPKIANVCRPSMSCCC